MSDLTRDGTAEPVLRGRIFRRQLGEGKKRFPVQLTLATIYSAESADDTYST